MDYPRFAQPLRDQLCENAQRLAAENGLKIEFIRRTKSFRKTEKVRQILRQRGSHPGLVCIFSALEPGGSYQPWPNKQTGKTYLRPDDGKCRHDYFYFIDPDLGLCYVRVPTWCPFRLQIYLNGHHRLARRREQQKVEHVLLDNAFHRDRKFRTRSGPGRRLAGGAVASAPGRVRPALLPRDGSRSGWRGRRAKPSRRKGQE